MAAPAQLAKANDVDNTKTLVRGSRIHVYSFQVLNQSGGAVHLQMFDAAATGDITLGTTEPDIQVHVADGADDKLQLGSPMGVAFPDGLVIAATTTVSGSDDPGAGVDVYLQVG